MAVNSGLKFKGTEDEKTATLQLGGTLKVDSSDSVTTAKTDAF